jgi:uncharacterized protein (DUF2252 family)
MPQEETPMSQTKKKRSKKATAVAEMPAQTHTQPVADRLAAGKALRKACPREGHADWQPPANRADPVDLLIENSRGRVEELVPIRYGRMMANPFAFFRGSAAIMAYDLSHTPSTGLNLQICGDAHLLNFGGFATAERKLIFDINDFDETSIGPWEWDVKRLVASFVIAGRANGFAARDCREAARQAARSYRQRIEAYAEMPVLEVWYDAMDLDKIIKNAKDKEVKRYYKKKLKKAQARTAHEKEFAKLAYAAGAPARIIDQPPLIFHYNDVRDDEARSVTQQGMADYKASLSPDKHVLLDRYELSDVAFKVVGVGSVGTFCGIALLMSGNGDPLFLQFKQARPSVLEPYAGASPYAHAGQRVVVGQKLMQAAGDMFLGWSTGKGRREGMHFYVRQLKDAKIKPVVEVMNPFNLKNYATLCGQALAQSHTSSGDVVVLSGYMGQSSAFEDAMADFGVAYADQNERDYTALVEAVRNGRIEARSEEA